MTGIRAGDDLGPGRPVGMLSDLRLDHADALDDAAARDGIGAVPPPSPRRRRRVLHRPPDGPQHQDARPDDQHLTTKPLPRETGRCSWTSRLCKRHKAGLSGPLPVMVEVLAYGDSDRQGGAFVVSNAAAELIVPAGK